jgi:hypothetical protein
VAELTIWDPPTAGRITGRWPTTSPPIWLADWVSCLNPFEKQIALSNH